MIIGSVKIERILDNKGNLNYIKFLDLENPEFECREYSDGSRFWYQSGNYHRESGPAVEYLDGTKWWYQNGELHREDGPAFESPKGVRGWWINNKRLTEQEFVLRTSKLYDGKIFEIEGKKYKLTLMIPENSN